MGVEGLQAFELKTNPLITNTSRNFIAPTSLQSVLVRAKIVDNGALVNTKLFYSLDHAATWQSINMAADTAANFYKAEIPAQPNGTFVRYYVWSQDNDGEITTQPPDIKIGNFFYTVRDQGLTIYDVQYTPFGDEASGYVGFSVTVTGVVTGDSSDFSNEFFIQDGTQPWNGLWVRESLYKPKRGDNVTVTGLVEEQFNQTRINVITANGVVLNSRDNPVPAPLLVKTGEIRTGATTAECYESMLVQVRNVFVVNPFPDGPRNFGEFTVSDGSGEVWVDDRSREFLGNLDSTFAKGDSLRTITGILVYDFNNFRIAPRNKAEVVRGKTTAVKDQASVPFAYRLEQNYPNPFNPETTIRYQLAKAGRVELVIFNMLGQKVRTLVNGVKNLGNHVQVWDGKNDRGQVIPTGIYFYRVQSGAFTEVKKMLVVR